MDVEIVVTTVHVDAFFDRCASHARHFAEGQIVGDALVRGLSRLSQFEGW